MVQEQSNPQRDDDVAVVVDESESNNSISNTTDHDDNNGNDDVPKAPKKKTSIKKKKKKSKRSSSKSVVESEGDNQNNDAKEADEMAKKEQRNSQKSIQQSDEAAVKTQADNDGNNGNNNDDDDVPKAPKKKPSIKKKKSIKEKKEKNKSNSSRSVVESSSAEVDIVAAATDEEGLPDNKEGGQRSSRSSSRKIESGENTNDGEPQSPKKRTSSIKKKKKKNSFKNKKNSSISDDNNHNDDSGVIVVNDDDSGVEQQQQQPRKSKSKKSLHRDSKIVMTDDTLIVEQGGSDGQQQQLAQELQEKNDNAEETANGDAEEADNSSSTNKDKKQSIMDVATSKALRPFVIISSSYLLFTITDGAIRMIVLLHAYNKRFSALEVAIMFTLYELAGVFTNLAAGIMGARWGIRFTLVCGLTLQLVSYALLFGWQDDWTKTEAIIYVTFAQMFAGVAKDLTKLGGKTVTKLVTPEEQDTKLFKLVSLITGWKNSLKGVGYFLGSALLGVSYELALGVMMILVALAMPWAIFGLDPNLGTAKKKNASWSEVFDLTNWNLNWLSLARLFLFASRDFWFEVPLPFFLRSPSCIGLGIDTCAADSDCSTGAICGASGFCENLNPGGGCGGLGVDRVVVGAFLGGYIILYGQVQSWTPQLVTGPLSQTPPNKLTEILWGYINCLPTLVGWIVLAFSPSFQDYDVTAMTVWIVVIVVTFAIIFAINSSIHSFLVVAYASKEKVAVSVGFYYMSNALGRLFGTIGSGILYTYVGEDFGDVAGTDAVAGLAACFLAGTICSFLAASITFRIDDDAGGLKCGPCLTLVAPAQLDDDEIKADETTQSAPAEEKV